MSMSCFGVTPYFSKMAASSIDSTLLRPITVEESKTVVLSLTSCRLSRSPVAKKQSSLRAVHAAASVPSKSSASQPSTAMILKPSAVSNSLSTGICCASSGGMPWRVAL